MKKLIPALILFGVSCAFTYAQEARITGKIVEKVKQDPLVGVYVILTNTQDSTHKQIAVTDNAGNFSINDLRIGATYKLSATYVGYKKLTKIITIHDEIENVGTISLGEASQNINEVVIKGQAPPAIQKGDTTELNASAFKVNPDANAQDMVQKMPGVTIESGTVKAHGEEVKRVMIDGKYYFGDDPSMALQNLPAEVIDKVQIYNKLSDQAEFTGFDDGQSYKVMNIITRADKRNGTTGLLTLGTDFQDKYTANGRLITSQKQQRLTIIGGSNNVNQQNFNMQDLLGATSRGGGGGGRGGPGGGGGSPYVGQQSGINTTHSVGINYSNTFNKKLSLTGSYFFNSQHNKLDKLSNTMFYNTQDSTKFNAQGENTNRYSNQLNNSKSMNFNHRFDMRLEYTIDSANSIVWSPRFSTQLNDGNYKSNQLQYYDIESPESQLYSNSGNNGLGYNYSSDLVFRHKFAKKGRTVSLGVNYSGNLNNSDGITQSLTIGQTRNQGLGVMDTVTMDQKSNSKTKGETISSNLSYTEPIGKNGIIQVSYNASFNNNNTNVYSYDQKVVPARLDTSLSNVYKNNYNTQRGGISYRIRGGENLNASIGVDYQRANLTGRRTFPQTSNVDKAFDNLLPNVMLNYKISKTANLRVFYRTSTNPPSINQLQDVVIISNSLSFSQGNPDLKHQYAHNGMVNYRVSNPTKSTNYSVNFFGGYTKNTIGNSIEYMKKDSVIIPGDTVNKLKTNGTLTTPLNFGGSWNTRVFLNYGYLFQPLKLNINLMGGGGYTTSPGSVDKILSITKQYNLTGGVVLGSNISQNVDFTLTYTANYTIGRISYTDSVPQRILDQASSINSNAWYHSISVRSNFILKGFVLQNTFVEQINRGLAGGYNQTFLQWNIAFGKKFMKNNAAELKLSIFDVLNQNKNITHTVSASNTTDSSTNTLQRFALLTFTYNLRNYKAPADDHDHGPGRGGFGPGRPF
jgi:hypothetical protein